MIAPVFLGARNRREALLGEEPLPDKLLGRTRVFLLEGMIKKHTRVAGSEITVMKFTHYVNLVLQFRHDHLWNRNGSVLVALAMYREYAVIEVEILDSQFDAFEKTKSAAIQKFDHDIEGVIEMHNDRVYLGSGKNYWNISGFFRPGYVPLVAEIFFENMPKEKQQGIEGLVLGRGGDPAIHRQMSEIFFDISRGKIVDRLVSQIVLKLAYPIRIGFERFAGIMSDLDFSRQLVDGLVPDWRFCFFEASPFVETLSSVRANG